MDIYFLEEYGKLYENIESGEFVQFIHKSEYGEIQHNFIKRPIKQNIVNEKYYDLITPYGYGGPIIKSVKGDIELLVDEFKKSFEEYCKANNVVSEFVRFHPILQNNKHFKEVYDIELNRYTALTYMESKNNFDLNFSKSARKTVRKCLKDELTYSVVESPGVTEIEQFESVYESTLKRNQADNYYYFNRCYFKYLVENLNSHIVIINVNLHQNTISSAIYFVYGNYMHAHLSGTKSDYLSYSPAYLIKYAATEYAENNGLKYIHHGGGTSTDPEDSLLLFKKKFTNKKTVPFYIGKKIYNEAVYKKLTDDNQRKSDFFPQYRFRKEKRD